MNEKLKQSLDTRLGGMRWGERDQAEVFRQIQRKELQNVKHVKRGSGMLAIAMALLFIVMGAAFALTNQTRQEEHVAGQTAEPAFIPVSQACFENEYFLLTVDSAACTESDAALTATIRMKDPQQYMLRLDGHMPPGDTARTPILTEVSAAVSTMLPGDVMMACGNLDVLDVTQMTADSAVFSVSGSVGGMGDTSRIHLWLTWTDPTDGSEHSEEIIIPLDAPSEAILLLQGPLLTAVLTSCEPGAITIDVTPSKSWYTLNRQEEGKTTLTVSGEGMALYPGTHHEEVLGQVDRRTPPAGEMAGGLSLTPNGLRMILTGEIPAGHDMLYGYIDLTIQNGADGVRYAEVLVPIPVSAMQTTPAAATPTPTPAPVAVPATPAPLGTLLDKAEIVSIYRETSWSDGFTTEATLRLRANNPEHRLTAVPNASGTPDGNTWVVRLTNSNESVVTTDISFRQDETTGDLLADITCIDLYDIYQDGLLDLTLTTTNELTWEAYSTPFRPVLPASQYTQSEALHLVSSTAEGLFLQGAMASSTRYHYIGVMLDIEAANHLQGTLLADDGTVLASNTSYIAYGSGLTRFPKVLFPYDGDGDERVCLFVLRVDRDTVLPEQLHLQLTSPANGGPDEPVDLILSVAEASAPTPAPVAVPATPAPVLPTPVPPVRSEPTGECIDSTDTVSIYLESSWYDGFSGEVTLRVRADDPDDRLAIAPNLEDRPHEQTWVVQAEGNGNDYYRSRIIPTITREDATGDIIVHLTYNDPTPTGDAEFNMPVLLSIVNEKTWETETAELSLALKVAEEFPWQPLYLVDSESPDAFIQAGYIITDRYTYIGVMQTYDNHYPTFTLADAEGNLLAPATISPASNPAFEMLLFPNVNVSAEYVTTSVVRLEGTQPLPETLMALFHTQDGFFLLHFELSTRMPEAGDPASAAVIHENEYVFITLHSTWYDGRSANVVLQTTLRQPETYAFIESADSPVPEGKQGISLMSMVGYSNDDFSLHGWMETDRTWQMGDSLLQQFTCCDVSVYADELLIGGYIWLTTPYGEETLPLNLSIPRTGLWRSYALTPADQPQMIRIDRAMLSASTHASYYTIDFTLAAAAPQAADASPEVRIVSVNDAPLTPYFSSIDCSDGLFTAAITAQTRLTPQTAVLQFRTTDGVVLEEILCEITEDETP